MLISNYNSLLLPDKAKADAKTSSKNFKNINYELLNETSKDDNRTYENLFYSYFKNREKKSLIFKRSIHSPNIYFLKKKTNPLSHVTRDIARTTNNL